jgi:hypothetical protein
MAPSTLHRLESGEAAALETYARVAAALGVRAELSIADGARRQSIKRDQDAVHAAMGDLEARQLHASGFPLAIDEPYQHYQFAGRVDLAAWDLSRRALLVIENRTRFPNLQEAAGAYNAKRAYFPAALAERLAIRGGWLSVTHAVVALWSSEVLHAVRLRRSTFEALCPDPLDAFHAWWEGAPPNAHTTSTLAILDPAAVLGRRRRFVGLDAVERVEPRYRDYADAAAQLAARAR